MSNLKLKLIEAQSIYNDLLDLIPLEFDSEGDRTIYGLALGKLVNQHFKAILLLLRPENQIASSAFALARPLYEAMLRSVWILNCATPKEVKDYKYDKAIPSVKELIRVIQRERGIDKEALLKSYDIYWKALCGFTHGGVVHSTRLVDSSEQKTMIVPKFKEEEIAEILHFSIITLFFSVIEINRYANNDENVATVFARFNKYSGT